jgi:hypothetical protein
MSLNDALLCLPMLTHLWLSFPHVWTSTLHNSYHILLFVFFQHIRSYAPYFLAVSWRSVMNWKQGTHLICLRLGRYDKSLQDFGRNLQGRDNLGDITWDGQVNYFRKGIEPPLEILEWKRREDFVGVMTTSHLTMELNKLPHYRLHQICFRKRTSSNIRAGCSTVGNLYKSHHIILRNYRRVESLEIRRSPQEYQWNAASRFSLILILTDFILAQLTACSGACTEIIGTK